MPEPKIENLERMGFDKPIENLGDAIAYIKRLSQTLERRIPYTSSRLHQCMMVMKKAQQKINIDKKR